MSEPKLSWRVPTGGDPRQLRLALAQVGLATIVAALVLLVAAPRDWLVPALVGLIPLAILMAFLRWKRYQQSMVGDDNVWLDGAGFHWLDSTGQEQLFRRAEVTAFRIGDSQETLRAVAALTLYLKGGFESQPIELHPPATMTAVRELLGSQWKLVECERTRDNYYDVRAEVFSECDPHLQEWHWEGSRSDLFHFFALIQAAADELPPPPTGAKPAKRIILANRRQPTRLHIAPSHLAHLDENQILAPAEVLRQISRSAAIALAESSEQQDLRFDVECAPNDRWTFYLHVRP